MKKMLVTAGGTATAWHISQIANEFFNGKIEIHVCDTNKAELVPTVVSTKKVHTVPPVVDKGYSEAVGEIINREGIDCILPLIPEEAYLFAPDSEFVRGRELISSAPLLETTRLLADKENLFYTLDGLGIPTPRIYTLDRVEPDKEYLLKPRLGFGSMGVQVIKGEKIKSADNDIVIQDYCHSKEYDEVTVEVYNGKKGLHIFSRRRIATKAGVCVKMEPVDSSVFFPYIKKLVNSVECPVAFNVQFLYDQGLWKLFDCNLRLGAGTALSSAIGFQLTRALLAEMIGESSKTEWFDIDENVKTVLRVYKEVVVR